MSDWGSGFATFRVVSGRGAASGLREYSEIGGSIRAQIPVFEELGFSLRAFHPATINAEIAPAKWRMIQPLFSARNVRWLAGYPGEDFDFANVGIRIEQAIIPALVYYPRPETKGAYAPPARDDMIELLAPYIEGLCYGSIGQIFFNPAQIELHSGARAAHASTRR